MVFYSEKLTAISPINDRDIVFADEKPEGYLTAKELKEKINEKSSTSKKPVGDNEEHRLALIKMCKDRNIKVHPKTGIEKLEKALRDSENANTTDSAELDN